MKLTIAETKLLKDSISVISDLVTEASFKVTKDALELVAMDPANVAMVIYKLLSSSFVEYEISEEATISINLNEFKQVLRRIKPDDTLTIENPEAKLKLTLKGKSKREFEIPLIDLEEKEQKIPNLNFAVNVETISSVINDAVEDVDIIGESVTFIAQDKQLVISSASDLSKAQVEIKDDDTTKITSEEKVNAKYSIEYLKKMIQGSKLCDRVKLSFSKDYPLKLDYTLINKVSIAFILAPRVDND